MTTSTHSLGPPGSGEAGPALQTRPGNHTTECPAQDAAAGSSLPDRAENAQDGEDLAALEVARRLIALRVPVFAAPPALDEDGNWNPTGGVDGYWLPPEWQRTVPTLNWLDPTVPGFEDKAWRPGWALCAVAGVRFDVLDTDPRNGGDASRARLVALGLLPTVYAVATTPSGGTHELIAPLGIGSKTGFLPGLDLKGGKAGGSSRGFVFIAPTMKASKVSGEIRPYVWIST